MRLKEVAVKTGWSWFASRKTKSMKKGTSSPAISEPRDDSRIAFHPPNLQSLITHGRRIQPFAIFR
jgi:hypothetical protein